MMKGKLTEALSQIWGKVWNSVTVCNKKSSFILFTFWFISVQFL